MLCLFLLFSGILYAKGSFFEERLKILESIVDKQQVEMDLLKQENIELKQENMALIGRVERFDSVASSLLNDLNYKRNVNAETHENSLWLNGSSIRKKNEPNIHNFQNNKTGDDAGDCNKRMMSASERMMFHVFLSYTKWAYGHQIIKYDTEVLDTGNGYNEHDGIFTVPQSGTYVFTWTYLADYARYAVTEIVINGAAKGWTISDGSGQNLLLSPSSGLVLARVNAGDNVFIRRRKGNACTVFSGSYMQSTFSGWLLSP